MQAGTVLGAYRIERELGSGGMGRVYAATGPDGMVALKVVHPHILETADAVERFRREVEIGQRVDHPNVVRTFGGGQTDGRHFMAMEYVEGQTLDELLADLERVPEGLCRHIGREVCKGLGAIHAVGAVHRDVKPGNVLITQDNVVKVMDLGVARSTDDALRLSQTGAFVGSLHYAAPEQFQGGGKGLDGRVDLHGLGLVLYELACGSSPYIEDEVSQIVRRVLYDEPRRLGEINPQLSAFFEEVVHCLLEKERDARFASAAELLSVLEAGEDSPWWRERARALQIATRRPIRRIRIPRETAVYGRDDDIAKLRALYERARSGDGNVVLIEGEAGIGKSRVVDELIRRLQQDGEELDFLFGSYPPGGAATAAGAFSTAYREQFGEAGSAPFLPGNPALVPAFDALLRGDTTPADAQPLTKGSLQTCFVRATRTLATERVVVVLIDDLHFAPDEGLALFMSLAMGVQGHRVLLVGTTRRGGSEEWAAGLSRLEHASLLQLSRLSPKDLFELLRDTLQSERLAHDLSGQIALKSDGNPFFVFEIVRGLREGQYITRRKDGSWVSTGVIEEIQIPSSVLDLVNARVAGLTEDERALLDVAACWGYQFDPALVGEVVGLARIPALRSFAQVERAHRLVRSSGRSYVFDHHQVQEALYGSLNVQLREEYHAALAEALETRTHAADADPQTLGGALCVDLSEHYLKGARGEQALRYLAAAQAHLAASYLHAQVAALTERALATPRLLTGVERARALLRVAAALGPLGRRAREEQCAREAGRVAEEVGDEALRGRAAQALGSVLLATFRTADAGAAYRRMLEIAIARGDREAEAEATLRIGSVLRTEGRLPEARERLQRALEISGEIGDRRCEAHARAALGVVLWDEGSLSQARAQLESAVAVCREIGNRTGGLSAALNLAIVLWTERRLGEAQKQYEECLAVSREMGNRVEEALAMGNLGMALASRGRLGEAREYYEHCLVLSREIGHRALEVNTTGNLANLFYAEGRLRESREHHERALALSREVGHREAEARALFNVGRVLFQDGESERAKENLIAGLSLSDDIGQRHLSAVSHLLLGVLHVAEGNEESGRASFVAVGEIAADADVGGVGTIARCYMACLPGGDPADALAAFTENDEHLDAEERCEALWLLFRATGDRAHLVEAKRLVDETVVHVDDETRCAMLTNLRVNREIMVAWNGDAAARG